MCEVCHHDFVGDYTLPRQSPNRSIEFVLPAIGERVRACAFVCMCVYVLCCRQKCILFLSEDLDKVQSSQTLQLRYT